MITSDTYKNEHVGNDRVNRYDYDFKIFSQEELLVYVVSPEGVRSDLTLSSDYSVSGVLSDGGGAVTLIGDGDHLASGNLKGNWQLLIEQNVAVTQNRSIGNQEKLNRREIENALDKLTAMIQQVKREETTWEGGWDANTRYGRGALVFWDGRLFHAVEDSYRKAPPGTTQAEVDALMITDEPAVEIDTNEKYWEDIFNDTSIKEIERQLEELRTELGASGESGASGTVFAQISAVESLLNSISTYMVGEDDISTLFESKTLNQSVRQLKAYVLSLIHI